MLVDYIAAHRDRFGVEPICTVLKDADVWIAPITDYAARNRPPSLRAVRDAELTEEIKAVHKANLGVYGARKDHAEMRRRATSVARCTVEWLMQTIGLRGTRGRRRPGTPSVKAPRSSARRTWSQLIGAGGVFQPRQARSGCRAACWSRRDVAVRRRRRMAPVMGGDTLSRAT